MFNGALDRVAILDRFGMPLPETLVMTESETVQLDALGYDAYGNTILVTPTWATELGHVTSAGLVDTLDADGSGRVTATVGNVTGQQWLYATARSFTTTGVLGDPGAHTYNEHVAIAGETPYVVSLDDNTLRVRHRTNGVWVDDGGPVTEFVPTAARIAASTSRVQIAWIEGAPDGNRMRTAQLLNGTWQVSPETFVVDPDDGYVDQVDLAVTGNDVYIAYRQYRAGGYLSVHVKRWDGASWQLLGGRVDSEGAGSMPSLAFVGGIPHVAYQHEASPFQVYVRRWIGGSWQRLGDALNVYTDYHAYRPQLIDSRGRPVVAFRQENLSTGSGSGLYPVYIREWDGTAWTQIDPGGIFSPGDGYKVTQAWSLATSGDALYVSWIETAPSAPVRRRVMKRNQRTGAWNDIATWGQILPAIYHVASAAVGSHLFVTTSEYDGPYRVRVYEYR